MTRTFLLTLDVPSTDPSTLLGLAESIEESLAEDGLTVISVKPWEGDDSQTQTFMPDAPLTGKLF